jgi:predicted amidohydrolase YtcJ
MFATLVVINARIITMENDEPYSAMAVVEELIVAVGSYEEVAFYIGPDTQIIDARGTCILPGFIDTQVQLFDEEHFMKSEDLSLARSKEQLVQILKKGIISKDIKEKQWIFGHSTTLIEEGWTALSERDLGRISSNHPILILGKDGRSALINRRGQDLLHMEEIRGITLEEGYLDYSALNWVKFNLRSQMGIEALKKTIVDVTTVLSKRGFTSIHTDDQFGFGYNGNINDLYHAYEQLRSEDKMNQRIYHQVQSLSDDQLKVHFSQPFRSGDGNAWFKIGAMKLKAYTMKGYDRDLSMKIRQCHQNDYQVLLQANDLSQLEGHSGLLRKLQEPNGGCRRLWHTLQFEKEGLGLSVADDSLVSGYACNDDRDHQSITIFQRIQELAELECYGLSKETTIRNLLNMFTINAAKIEFSEREKGSIKPGKLADFIQVDCNPYDLPLHRLGEIKVMNTYINGRQIYSA